ncbi:MAG TPA: CHAT domain-containing protein, partial [Allocoleopsis sp.]
SGGQGGGDIIIIQKGPFLIGNSMVSGTSGVITTGNNNTITPRKLIPDPLFIQGKITIINQGDGNNNEGLQQLIKNTLDKNEGKIENNRGLINILLTDNTREITTKNVINSIDEPLTQEFGEYIGKNIAIDNLKNPQETLNQITTATGVKPALIYVLFTPSGNKIKTKELEKIPIQDTDELEIIMITGKGNPVRKRIIGVTRSEVLATAKKLRIAISNSRSDKTYMKPGKQLYDWIIAPIEKELEGQKINNLVFLMEGGLRSLPLAALYDGENFLIEKYSIGLMPSLSITDTNYTDIKTTEVLAMGSDTFAKETLLQPLPAVSVEINAIASKVWKGKSFLNEQFTLENLKLQRQNKPYGIIHLATHAEFKPGKLENSYIQLWDGPLRLNKLRELGWDKPPVELLVLSACKTAVGDNESELGFAGLAVAAGVKTAMGSLWYVSDEGTLGLMTNFYAKLKKAPIKSEALRQAQISMLRGEVRIENGKLVTPNGTFDLPPDLAKLSNMTLSNPYYWSGFVMIGNPW